MFALPLADFVAKSLLNNEEKCLLQPPARQVESGTPVAGVCRKMGVVEQTFYRWKKKYMGMGIAELRRLRVLEEENRKLKQLVADLSLDKQMLQDVLRKNRFTSI